MMHHLFNQVISNAGITLTVLQSFLCSAPQSGEIPFIQYLLLVVVFIGVCAPIVIVLVLMIYAGRKAAIERKHGSVFRNRNDKGKNR